MKIERITIDPDPYEPFRLAQRAKIMILIVDHNKERFRVMTEEVERVWGDNKPDQYADTCPRPCA